MRNRSLSAIHQGESAWGHEEKALSASQEEAFSRAQPHRHHICPPPHWNYEKIIFNGGSHKICNISYGNLKWLTSDHPNGKLRGQRQNWHLNPHDSAYKSHTFNFLLNSELENNEYKKVFEKCQTLKLSFVFLFSKPA